MHRRSRMLIAPELLAPVLVFCACSGGHGAVDGGTGEDHSLVGDSRMTPSNLCDAYLECLSAAQPEAFPAALQIYRGDGPCWASTSAADKCEKACKAALDKLATSYPSVPECKVQSSHDASVCATTKTGFVCLDGAPVQSSSACTDASSEPNNTSATAAPLSGSGTFPGWEICYAGDVDNYSLSLPAGKTLAVKIVFAHAKGDLDAAAIDTSGNALATAQGVVDNELLTVTQSSNARNVVVAVYGYNGATNLYDLEVTLTP